MGGSSSKDKNNRLLETVVDHEGDINCMCISEDKSLLITGSEDGTARLWSARTEKTECLGILKGHTSYITCATISDVYVITGAADNTIRKWDMTTCECLKVYKGHDSRIYRLIVSTDFIFSTSYDKTAKAWIFDVDGDSDCEDDDDERNGCIRSFRGHNMAVYPIIYIPGDPLDDGEESDEEGNIIINPKDLIITGSADNTAKSWSFDTGGCIKTYRGHRAAVMCMVTDDQGKTLYTGSADRDIRSWNISKGDCLKVMEGHKGPIICLTLNNRLMYSGSQDGTARCWVREFGDCTRVYRGCKHSVTAVKFHEGMLYTSSGDTCARAYDAKSGSLKKLFAGHLTGIQCMVIANNKLYTGSSDNTFRVWNIEKMAEEDNKDENVISDSDSDDADENATQHKNISNTECEVGNV